MATVFGIVKRHKGLIDVISGVNQGTSIIINFKKGIKKLDNRKILDKKSLPTSGTILVIEDDDLMRNLTKSMIISLGLSALTASNGKQGITLYSEKYKEIQAEILDMRMPDMNEKGKTLFKAPEVPSRRFCLFLLAKTHLLFKCQHRKYLISNFS